MSQPRDENRVELHLFTQREYDDEIAELLTATAHYHRTGHRLGAGHTVNFGRPWIGHSECDRGLISLPYLDGPTLEWLDLGSVRVRFLWLIPVTKREVDYIQSDGLESFEQRLESAQFNYLDVARKSVV